MWNYIRSIELQAAVTIVVSFALIGPFIMACGVLIGGDTFDGFAAAPTKNTSLQDGLFEVGMKITVGAGLVGLAISLLLCVVRTAYDRLFLLLPLIAIITPILSTMAVIIIGAVLANPF